MYTVPTYENDIQINLGTIVTITNIVIDKNRKLSNSS